MVFVTQGSTAQAFVPQNNVCGRQDVLTTRDGHSERVYTEESPCQAFYDSKSVAQAHAECQTCWKRALQLDHTCPCAMRKEGKEGLCELTQCVSAHPTQCQNTYGAIFQQFAAQDIRECSNIIQSPSKESYENNTRKQPMPLAFWISFGTITIFLIVRIWIGTWK